MAREGVLVIGYGSELRGDDAAGPEAARRLAALGFEAIETHQLTPELADRVAGARAVYFLDAHAGVEPGEVSVMRVAEGAGGALEHQGSPAALLRLARVAYGAAPEAWLVGIGGEGFEFGAGLSRAARMGVERAVRTVRERELSAISGQRSASESARSACVSTRSRAATVPHDHWA